MRGMQLRTHCAAFCQALTRHHTAEDNSAFPMPAAQFPELAPVPAELRADHGRVAEILRRLDDLLASVPPDAETVHRKLDGLTAILESHFHWEKRRLTKALNDLADSGGTSGELLGIDVTSGRHATPADRGAVVMPG